MMNNMLRIISRKSFIASGEPEAMRITIGGLPGRASVLVETLDQTRGNAVSAWVAMGKPEPPTREQAAQLRHVAEAVRREILHADASGHFNLERPIEPWSLVLI